MNGTEIDRNALDDLVWKEPISTLAKTYGYSDVGFSKLCRKLDIPLPGRGHWARTNAGQKIRQPPLTAAKHHHQSQFRLSPLTQEQLQEVAVKRKQEASIRESISVTAEGMSPDRLHPLALQAKQRLKQKDGWSDHKSLRSAPREVLDIEVTKDAIDRAVQIASLLLHELERMATVVQIDTVNGQTILGLRGARIGFKISEHVARSTHEMTTAEKRAMDRYRDSFNWKSRSVEYPNIPQFDFAPTGQLTVTANGYPRRNWRDTKHKPLEQRMSTVVAGIIALAEEVRDREAEAARRQAEYQCKVDHYNEEMKRRSDERSGYRGLRIDAKKWVAANQLRDYVRAVEASAAQSGTLSTELELWIDWAMKKAGWLDPTILVSDVILDAPEPKRPGYSYW